MRTPPLKVKFTFLLLLLPLTAVLTGCNIPSSGVKLKVPYRSQPTTPWDYCGPACVLMWRLYDGRGEISQSTIYSYMQGSGGGVSPEAIRNAVAAYTYTSDAYLDRASCDGGPFDEKDKVVSRQIASIDARSPVISIVNAGFHAVVIDGGKWHEDTQTLKDVWDYAYIHDPQQYADVYYVAGDWIDWFASGYACEQILSFSAAAQADYYLANHGDDVTVRGYLDWPREREPIEY